MSKKAYVTGMCSAASARISSSLRGRLLATAQRSAHARHRGESGFAQGLLQGRFGKAAAMRRHREAARQRGSVPVEQVPDLPRRQLRCASG
jgi:hypothetical protein